MKLTAKGIRALELPDGKSDHLFWDDEIPRFSLRLRDRGNPRIHRLSASALSRRGSQEHCRQLENCGRCLLVAGDEPGSLLTARLFIHRLVRHFGV